MANRRVKRRLNSTDYQGHKAKSWRDTTSCRSEWLSARQDTQCCRGRAERRTLVRPVYGEATVRNSVESPQERSLKKTTQSIYDSPVISFPVALGSKFMAQRSTLVTGAALLAQLSHRHVLQGVRSKTWALGVRRR